MTGPNRTADDGPTSTIERFFLADRRVGWVTGATTLAATQISAGTLVGAVGIHYLIGVSFGMTWAGIWLGWLFSMRYVAPQLRASGCVTIPEFFQRRFDDEAGGSRVRAVSAVLIAVIYLTFTAAQYVAGGVVLDTAFGVPPVYGMTGLALLALAYTAVGGMRASVVTDALLAAVLVGGLVVATGIGLSRIGGIGGLHTAVTAVDPALLGVWTQSSEVLGFALAFGLSLAVAPYEASRVYAMRDGTTVRKAIGGSLVIQAVIAVCIAVLGLLARTRFPGLANPDAAVVSLITTYFGPVVGGALLFAILAAVLSTVDSVLLVSSSALVYDFYESLPERWKTRFADRGGNEERGNENGKQGGSGNENDEQAGSGDEERIGSEGEETTPEPGEESGPLPGGQSILPGSSSPVGTVPSEVSVSESTSVRTLGIVRIGTVLSGLVPLGLAVNSGRLGGLVQLIVVLYAALVAGALFVPVVLGVHRDGVPSEGIVAGMVVGTASVFVWHVFVTAPSALTPGVSAVPPVAVGVASNALVVAAVATLRR